MSGEEEIIYINMDSDSDESISDDGDELFSEDFGSDIIEDTSSLEDFTIDSELEDSDNSSETEDEYDTDNGDDGDDEEDEDDDEDHEEHLPENLKRHRPSSVTFSPLTKRRQPSISDAFMQLEELLERTNRQITNIYEAVSRMPEVCGVSQMEKCRNCGEILTPAVPAVQGQGNPEETVLQPMAEDKPEKLVPDADLEPGDGGAQETNPVIISADQPAVEAPLVVQQPADSGPANDPNGMIYPVLVGIENIIPDVVIPFVYIPPNLEIPENTEVIIINSNMAVNNLPFEENQQDTFTPTVYHNFDIPVIPEAVLVNNPETVNYPPTIGGSSDHQNLLSSTGPATDSEIKEVVLIEMPEKTEVTVDGNKQTVVCPGLLGNVLPPDPETIAASISSKTVIEKLILVEMSVDPESIVDDNPETVNNPTIVQNVGGQEPAASSVPSAVEAYLGDPRRNIRLPNFHLVTAKNKPTPTYAACYLANVIFSEEILLLSSVAGRTSHCIFMDQNKLSAIREYLLMVFPNCDLSEQGKDWKDCISAIRFMIESLYTDAEIPTDRNFSVPMSTNWCTRKKNDKGEGPSQWLQDVRESIKRERVHFEHIPGADTEGSDNGSMNPDQLVYLGDPSRDIKIPYSVLKIAKTHLRPDLSAKYIILHLFPEEILIKSNVYGNMECGLFALDPNRIDALREFLQDNYPEYDLQETGYYWKLCVTAINSCLQTLRQGPRNVTG